MNEVSYDWEELLERLRAYGCSVSRVSLGFKRQGKLVETFIVEYRGQAHPLQIRHAFGRPTFDVLRSLCDNLGLSHSTFGI